MNEPGPLSFYTIEELWEELAGRAETSVMCMVISKDESTDKTAHFLDGNITNCMGLARYLYQITEDIALMGLIDADFEGGNDSPEGDSLDG